MEHTSNKFIIQLEGMEQNFSINVHDACAETEGTVVYANPTNLAGIYEVEWGNDTIPVMIESNGIDRVQLFMRGYSYAGRILREHHHHLLAILTSSEGMKTRAVSVLTPMPGLLKATHITNGTEVKKHQQLFTLEAMKMENSITAPIQGIIHDLTAEAGKAVDKGYRLCTIEPV